MVIYYDFGVYFRIFCKFVFGNGFDVKDYGNNDGGYINWENKIYFWKGNEN